MTPPDRESITESARFDRARAEHFAIELETITPLLGGGARTRALDEITPVRVSSIRGQLRFWWRALVVHTCIDARDLAERETAIFGGMRGQNNKPQRSRVDMWVTRVHPSGIDPHDPSGDGTYALWPARGTPAAPRREPGMRFTLHVRVPTPYRTDIERALRAWLLFGGLGGRTRRGCGSLTAADEKNRAAWLPQECSANELTRLLGTNIELVSTDHDRPRKLPCSQTPRLHGATLAVWQRLHPEPGEAWHQALHALEDFRQGAPDNGFPSRSHPDTRFARARAPRGENPRRPGRSRWPEPDAIRVLMRQHSRGHEPRYTARLPAWPRAGLGLPIISRFQPMGRKRGERYDPPEPGGQFTLVWQDKKGHTHDRLASPLIIKAMPLANGKFVPIALWLERAPPDGHVVLTRDGKTVMPRSGAPFDHLIDPDDTPLYQPLTSPSLRQGFFDWLCAVHHTHLVRS